MVGVFIAITTDALGVTPMSGMVATDSGIEPTALHIPNVTARPFNWCYQ
jgi:hypothetical protein